MARGIPPRPHARARHVMVAQPIDGALMRRPDHSAPAARPTGKDVGVMGWEQTIQHRGDGGGVAYELAETCCRHSPGVTIIAPCQNMS